MLMKKNGKKAGITFDQAQAARRKYGKDSRKTRDIFNSAKAWKKPRNNKEDTQHVIIT